MCVIHSIVGNISTVIIYKVFLKNQFNLDIKFSVIQYVSSSVLLSSECDDEEFSSMNAVLVHTSAYCPDKAVSSASLPNI